MQSPMYDNLGAGGLWYTAVDSNESWRSLVTWSTCGY